MTSKPAAKTLLLDAVVSRIESPRPSIRIIGLRLKDGSPLSYRAGQYTALSVKDFPPRFYSIASAPGAPDIEIHIKDARNGGVSTYASRSLAKGDAVLLSAPQGDAVSDPGDTRPVLAIAGGVGITPVKAVIEDLLNHNHPGPIHLFWGAGLEEDLYLKDYFTELARKKPALKFTPVVQKPVTNEALASFGALKNIRIHICGNPEMVRAALPLFAAKGALPADIYHDPLPPPKTPAAKLSEPKPGCA